jgi:CRISPR-associated protein Csx3
MPALQLTRIFQQPDIGLPYQLLHTQITQADGILEPTDLKELALPTDMNWKQGVVIEGKAPIWLYGYLSSQRIFG